MLLNDFINQFLVFFLLIKILIWNCLPNSLKPVVLSKLNLLEIFTLIIFLTFIFDFNHIFYTFSWRVNVDVCSIGVSDMFMWKALDTWEAGVIHRCCDCSCSDVLVSVLGSASLSFCSFDGDGGFCMGWRYGTINFSWQFNRFKGGIINHLFVLLTSFLDLF